MPKVGLALGSGGARGLAHIGVLKALVENNIPIDMIAGSSAGALVGALYGVFGSVPQLEQIARAFTARDIWSVFSDFGLSTGLIRGDRIEAYLSVLFSNKTIESLPFPYVSVATDVHTGEPVLINAGSLSKAIRASSSVPALVSATEYQGRKLIDGGVSLPVPIRPVRELGADVVIAVNLDGYKFSGKTPNFSDMGAAALNLLRFNLAKELCHESDITITPDVASISSLNPMEFLRGQEIINKGYTAAISSIPSIKKLLKS